METKAQAFDRISRKFSEAACEAIVNRAPTADVKFCREHAAAWWRLSHCGICGALLDEVERCPTCDGDVTITPEGYRRYNARGVPPKLDEWGEPALGSGYD